MAQRMQLGFLRIRQNAVSQNWFFRRNSMNKTLMATAIALAFGVSGSVLANPVNTNSSPTSTDGSVSQSATAESTQKKNSGAQANEGSTATQTSTDSSTHTKTNTDNSVNDSNNTTTKTKTW